MSATPSLVTDLDPEQLTIVRQPARARQLITAGPGTGKTYTLIGRIAWLVAKEELAVGHELLILTFSRSAVREIRDRCRQRGGDLAHTNVSTFDSFATGLLSEFDPEGDWKDKGYDDRIGLAVTLLSSRDEARQRLELFRHILIDEVQDLVGIRAQFAMAILSAVSCGFTIFGDPAQGIYNFQLEGEERNIGSATFYNWMRNSCGQALEERCLCRNYRSSPGLAQRFDWAGPLLNSPHPDYPRILHRLRSELSALPSAGNQDTWTSRLAGTPESVAILCRTNGQALMVSRLLFEHGIPHTLQRSATARYLPGWLATALRGIDVGHIDEGSFIGSLQRAGVSLETAEHRWVQLKRIVGTRGRTVDLAILSRRTRQGLVPDSVVPRSNGGVVVSSIHRAKGLEFERVIVVNERDDRQPEFVGEEARSLYVALTRARSAVFHLDLPAWYGLKLDGRANRWVRKLRNWSVNDLEVKPEDLDRAIPPRQARDGGQSPCQVQDYLNDQVKVGDSVRMVRVNENANNPQSIFEVVHEDTVIGLSSATFAHDVFGVVRGAWDKGRLPDEITQLRIEAVEAVVGSSAASANANLGGAGFWLAPRVSGLGKLHYKRPSP